MSSNPNLEEFQLISYRKKSRKIKPKQHLSHCVNLHREDFDKDVVKRLIVEAKNEIQASDLYTSFRASLREGLGALGNPRVKEIVCFGLGRIGECLIPRYQLGLLLCLKEWYDVGIHVFDPIFTVKECDLLKDLGCDLIDDNIEGKYEVSDGNITVFYLPHCSKQLSNNLLWANWGLNLSNSLIIANSFSSILENNTTKDLDEKACYISSIFPYVVELAIINTFKYFDIFNDTAIHIFPIDKLRLISRDFWDNRCEPKYISSDVEFITEQLQSLNH